MTPLGKAKQSKIQSKIDMGSKGDDVGEKGDKTRVPHDANINHPETVEALPEELKQQVEAKFNAILNTFLQSCTKDRRDKVTQYKEPEFSELITSTSSAPAAPEVRTNEPKYDDIVDPYPTHANYATMMDDHKKVIDNNLLAAVNMIMARFDKLQGKTTDGNQSGVASTSKQPEFGMPLNFYENQGLYAAANKGKSASSALETDKAGLASSAPSSQLVIYDQNLA